MYAFLHTFLVRVSVLRLTKEPCTLQQSPISCKRALYIAKQALFLAKEPCTLQQRPISCKRAVFQKSPESCRNEMQRALERDRAMTVARNRTYAKEPYIFAKQP